MSNGPFARKQSWLRLGAAAAVAAGLAGFEWAILLALNQQSLATLAGYALLTILTVFVGDMGSHLIDDKRGLFLTAVVAVALTHAFVLYATIEQTFLMSGAQETSRLGAQPAQVITWVGIGGIVLSLVAKGLSTVFQPSDRLIQETASSS